MDVRCDLGLDSCLASRASFPGVLHSIWGGIGDWILLMLEVARREMM